MTAPTAQSLNRHITDPDGTKKLVLTHDLFPSSDYKKMLELFELSALTITGTTITPDPDQQQDFTVTGETKVFGMNLWAALRWPIRTVGPLASRRTISIVAASMGFGSGAPGLRRGGRCARLLALDSVLAGARR